MATYTKAAGTIRGIAFPDIEDETVKNCSCTIEIIDLTYDSDNNVWGSNARLIISYTDLADGENKETEITVEPFYINWSGGLN